MTREKLHELFVTIRKRRRKLTPAIVVDEASAEDHPLHNEFDWDDASAAHKHRLDHAARLIRFVSIKIVNDDGDSYRVRQWHAVRAAGVVDAPQGYVPLDEVTNDPMYREAILRQMERDWRALQDRYGHYREFWATVEQSVRTRRPAKRRRRKAG